MKEVGKLSLRLLVLKEAELTPMAISSVVSSVACLSSSAPDGAPGVENGANRTPLCLARGGHDRGFKRVEVVDFEAKEEARVLKVRKRRRC